MRKVLFSAILGMGIFSVSPVFGATTTVSITADSTFQGNPARIIISGIKNVSDITSIAIDGISVSPFLYGGNIQALYGVDLYHATGTFPISMKLKDKKTVSGVFTILEREKPVSDFTIPDSLGGNTTAGEANVSTLLSKENSILMTLWTNPKKLWTKPFTTPLVTSVVTDAYGYCRDTGQNLTTHKGLDYRAPLGTPVYAMNRGIVRLVKTFSVYGKTVVIDHGQGIMTFYMHLSKVYVSQGSIVEKNKKIGLSGQTGYSLGPHLHVTVRANNISIDPEKFLEIYGE